MNFLGSLRWTLWCRSCSSWRQNTVNQTPFHSHMLSWQTESLCLHSPPKRYIAETWQDITSCFREQGLHSACVFRQAGVPQCPTMESNVPMALVMGSNQGCWTWCSERASQMLPPLPPLKLYLSNLNPLSRTVLLSTYLSPASQCHYVNRLEKKKKVIYLQLLVQPVVLPEHADTAEAK